MIVTILFLIVLEGQRKPTAAQLKAQQMAKAQEESDASTFKAPGVTISMALNYF